MIIFPGLLGSIATVKTLGIVTDGLILHLDAENPSSYPGSGTDWYDLTVNTSTASLENTTFSTGEYNEKWFDFNGSNSLAKIPNNVIFDNQTLTVETWIKAASLSQGGFFFEKGQVNSQYSLFLESGNIQWRQNIGGITNLTVNSSVLSGTTVWNQVVGTYSSGNRKLYVNGVLVGSDSQAGTINTDAGGISIGVYGGYSGARGYWYNGSISVVRVYNKQLTDAEVLQNYNALTTRYNPVVTIVGYTSGSSTFTSPDFEDSFEFQGNWNDTVDLTTILSGNTTFTSPDFTDSFEFQGNWNDTVDITTILSGNTTFTTPDFTDSFEFQGNWNDAVDITTVLSGNTTFTTPDFQDSFEFQENWNDAVDVTTALSGTTTFTSPDFTDSFETGSGGW